MDRGAWQATVHGVAKSQTRLQQLKRNHKTNQKPPSFSSLNNVSNKNLSPPGQMASSLAF